ncbi:receptor-like protein EIX2 [Humulus lupulus]|uniref:receptor-like protein EIX2 n=1 Tax=Humulus lupulus TaxID=3486 RepID=UPI002B41492E|nr:receptor-like protein EIX2 [Humulus lupulus]
MQRLVKDGVLQDLDFSDFTACVDCIKRKLTAKVKKIFKTKVELQKGKKIKAVNSDRGGEYYGRYAESGRNPRPFTRYLSDPGLSHWKAAKKVMRYLQGCVDDKRSTSGYNYMMAGGAVSWKSGKQTLTASLTMEAKYMACYEATCQAIWLRNFISALGVVESISRPLKLYCDNSAALQYLEYLNLSYNDFTKIPKFIGAFTNLKYLDFSDNCITGNIPSELGTLTNLRILDLSHSISLTANSFKWLSHLPYLRIFKLDQTNFNKAKGWFHSFKTAPSLSTLHLYDCQFPELDDSSFSHITNSTNSITTLDVSYSTFGSTTVSRLLNLSNNLVDLSLYDNNFNIKGSHLPDAFDNLKYLRRCFLQFNEFDGEVPKSIGSLCKLQQLVLSLNEFNSTMTDILESLLDCNNNSLETLNLSQNRLNGPLPRDLSRFSYLRELDVSYNKFSDTLPESIGNLSSLEFLAISGNSFIGVVSETHLEKLSKLKHLDLSSNSLTLKTNITWVPPFQLQYINLRSCTIGPQLPSWLQTQSNISYIDLFSSGISDVIPKWFFNMTSNLEYLDLSSNLINSTFPNSLLESNNKSPYVYLSSNKFHGCIPPYLLLKARTLNLSNNTLTCFEPLFCDQIDGTMDYLDLSNNQLFGSIPNCLFHLGNLFYLNLNNNRLSGVIPSSIASLYSIGVLGLRKNNLSGTLPSSMQNCTRLSLLDVGENSLGGTIPKWIGEILTNLVVLQLKSNHFYGTIPSSLCHLQYIQILDISHNRIYGAIPSCMNNFTSMAEKSKEFRNSYQFGSFETSIIWKGMEYEHIQNFDIFRVIDFSSNKLIGEIPMELTYLVGLNQLNLSRNSLGGAIPRNIGNLSGLESLDLSYNNFSGKIPTGLAELSFLACLNLSFNHLSGKIPTGTQLQSFNASSYVENFGLCGLPLLTECPGDHATSRNHDFKNYNELDQEWFDMSWFFISLEFGFALGFIGVCGASFLNFYRRLAYFRCLNKFEDWLYVMISVRVSNLKRYFNAKCVRKSPLRDRTNLLSNSLQFHSA